MDGFFHGQLAMHAAFPPEVEIAWARGCFIPRSELCVGVGDAGFVLGTTVTEQLRTMGGSLFLPAEHADRLGGSLAALGIAPPLPPWALLDIAAEVARHNYRLPSTPSPARPSITKGPARDLGVIVFVTPGGLPAQNSGRPGEPWAAVHSFPLAFDSWASAYDRGVSLRSVATRQVPEACWPLRAKVRSRCHYFLADREANAAEPGARAVLAHADGRISETSTANIAIVTPAGIATPPAGDALPGISLAFARQLAGRLGVPWCERSLAAADLASADEILLTSTPSCLLPGTRFDGQPIGGGRPGPVFRRLLSAWSDAVGFDIIAQATAAGGGW